MARVTPTPRPTAATNMPARTTRSQSRDFEPQPVQRRSARSIRGASVEGDETAARVKAAKQIDLSTVDEDVASTTAHAATSNRQQREEPIVETDNEDDEDACANVDGISHSRASAISGISGTTAKTSFSDEEIADMDPDVMLDSLSSLNSASDNLLECLIPRNMNEDTTLWSVWKDITTDGTKPRKLFLSRAKILDVLKNNYGSSEYIQPNRVLRAMFEVPLVDDVPDKIIRPDPVVRKANLATMLHMLLITARDSHEIGGKSYDALESAESAFATSVASGEFRDNDLEMALAISIQLAIKRLAACAEDPSYDPQGIATGVFFVPNDDGSSSYRYHNVLHLEDLDEEDLQLRLDAVESAVNELKKPFEDADIDVGTVVNRLRAKHPWDAFIKHLVAYYKERKRSLNQQIKGAGGVEVMVENIRRAIQGKAELAFAEEMENNLKESTSTPRSTFDKSEISKLRALSGRSATEASGHVPARPQGQAPTAQMVPQPNQELPPPLNSSAPLFFESDDEPAPTRRMPPTKIGKPSLLDRQTGARRVSWDEDSQASEQQTQVRNRQPQSSNHQDNVDPSLRSNALGKRLLIVDEDEVPDWDPTQDGEYQTAAYDPALADARRRQNAAIQHQSPRPAATMVPAGPSTIRTDIHGPMTSASASPSKRQRKNPGASVLSPGPTQQRGAGEVDAIAGWQQAKIDSNHARVLAAQQRPARQRKMWDEFEENCILTLIGECEEPVIKYAELKQQEKKDRNILADRTAEDLRFKARNMKVTMLRARQDLVGGWDKVQLAKKEIETLDSLGIPYEQPMMRPSRARGE